MEELKEISTYLTMILGITAMLIMLYYIWRWFFERLVSMFQIKKEFLDFIIQKSKEKHKRTFQK